MRKRRIGHGLKPIPACIECGGSHDFTGSNYRLYKCQLCQQIYKRDESVTPDLSAKDENGNVIQQTACIVCMDHGIVATRPGVADYCPATGCDARNHVRVTNGGRTITRGHNISADINAPDPLGNVINRIAQRRRDRNNLTPSRTREPGVTVPVYQYDGTPSPDDMRVGPAVWRRVLEVIPYRSVRTSEFSGSVKTDYADYEGDVIGYNISQLGTPSAVYFVTPWAWAYYNSRRYAYRNVTITEVPDVPGAGSSPTPTQYRSCEVFGLTCTNRECVESNTCTGDFLG